MEAVAPIFPFSNVLSLTQGAFAHKLKTFLDYYKGANSVVRYEKQQQLIACLEYLCTVHDQLDCELYAGGLSVKEKYSNKAQQKRVHFKCLLLQLYLFTVAKHTRDTVLPLITSRPQLYSEYTKHGYVIPINRLLRKDLQRWRMCTAPPRISTGGTWAPRQMLANYNSSEALARRNGSAA